MACSRQRGPASYLKFIQDATGEKITQADWHGLRLLVEEDGYDVSRTRVTSSMTDKTATALARNLGVTDDSKIKELKAELGKSNNTVATTSVIDYLSRFGVKYPLTRVRLIRENGKKNKPSLSYSDRVQALENEGIDTSDAQGIVDAENTLAATRAAKLYTTVELKEELDTADSEMAANRGVSGDAYNEAKVRLHAAYEELAQRGEVILFSGLHWMKLADEPTVPRDLLESHNYSFNAMKEIQESNVERLSGDDNWAESALARQDERVENRIAVLVAEGKDHYFAQGAVDAEEMIALEWSNRKSLTN